VGRALLLRFALLGLLLLSGCVSDASAGFKFGGAGGDDLAEWEDSYTVLYSAVGSASWTTAGGPYSVSSSSGTIAAVDHAVVNDTQSDTFGPDGTTGIDIDPVSGTLWWSSNDDAPYYEISISDLLGGAADDQTVFAVSIDFSGTRDAAWEAVGIGIVDGEVDGFVNRIRHSGGDKWHTGRFLATAIAGAADVVGAPSSGYTGLQIVVYGGGLAADFFYLTSGSLPALGTFGTQVDSDKDSGNIQANTAGVTARKVDPSALRLRVFVEEQTGDGTFETTIEGLSVWRATP